MKEFCLLLIFSGSLLLSCGRSNQREDSLPDIAQYYIDIEKSISNIKSIPLSLVGQEIEFIPLETNPNCLLKNIRQIALSDSFIFVCDINKLLQFDRYGRFIRQIGSQGRGPEEYPGIWDFSIDKKSKTIFIANTMMDKIMIFDFDGNFKKSSRLSFKPYSFILLSRDSLMFHANNSPMPAIDMNPVYSWYITNTEGANLIKLKNNLKRVKTPGFSVPETPLYIFEDVAHFMEFGIDTLYTFYHSGKKPYAVFNFGDIKMDIDPDISDKVLMDELNQKFWILSIQEDNENMYINIVKGLGGPLISCLFRKQDSEVIILENNSFFNDLCGEIPFWPKKIINDSLLIDYLEALRLLNFIEKSQQDTSLITNGINRCQLKELKDKITVTSNPVLVMVK